MKARLHDRGPLPRRPATMRSEDVMWDGEQILAAARDWVWVPADAERHLTDDLDIVAYPTYFEMPTQVLRSSSDGALDELVERARSVARQWGRESLFWWCTRDSPAHLEEALLAHGATVSGEISVLALDVSQEPPDLHVPPAVAVRRVDDAQTVQDSERIAASAFDTPPTPDERLGVILDEVRSSWQDGIGFRSIAYVDGQPAATGGCTMAGPVARLWGAGTRASYRGCGAYRGVLDHRLRVARGLGATLALVKGRVETSGPILRRAGFTAFGQEVCLRVPV